MMKELYKVSLAVLFGSCLTMSMMGCAGSEPAPAPATDSGSSDAGSGGDEGGSTTGGGEETPAE